MPMVQAIANEASINSPATLPLRAGLSVLSPLFRLKNVAQKFREGGLTAALNEAAASVPILGPAAEHASERMKSGDVAGGVGEVAGLASVPLTATLGQLALTKAATVGGRTAEGLMQSALKPGASKLRDVIKGKATTPPVVKTLLDEGISVSESGMGKLNRLLTAKNDELRAIIAQSSATISPDDVAARAMTSRPKIAAQVTPASDLKAFDAAIDEFVQAHQGSGLIKGGTPIPVQEAQALKTGTYSNLGTKAYGELKGASVEGQKALARGLKEEIEAAIPTADVQGINRQIGRLQEAQDPLGRRVALAANRDPAGLAPLAHSSTNFIAMLMLRDPVVKSMLARGMYQSAAKAARVPVNVLRAALIASMSESEAQR